MKVLMMVRNAEVRGIWISSLNNIYGDTFEIHCCAPDGLFLTVEKGTTLDTLPSEREAREFIDNVVKDGLTLLHGHHTAYVPWHIIRGVDVLTGGQAKGPIN